MKWYHIYLLLAPVSSFSLYDFTFFALIFSLPFRFFSSTTRTYFSLFFYLIFIFCLTFGVLFLLYSLFFRFLLLYKRCVYFQCFLSSLIIFLILKPSLSLPSIPSFFPLNFFFTSFALSIYNLCFYSSAAAAVGFHHNERVHPIAVAPSHQLPHTLLYANQLPGPRPRFPHFPPRHGHTLHTGITKVFAHSPFINQPMPSHKSIKVVLSILIEKV